MWLSKRKNPPATNKTIATFIQSLLPHRMGDNRIIHAWVKALWMMERIFFTMDFADIYSSVKFFLKHAKRSFLMIIFGSHLEAGTPNFPFSKNDSIKDARTFPFIKLPFLFAWKSVWLSCKYSGLFPISLKKVFAS